MSNSTAPERLDDDLLRSGEEIAQYLGQSRKWVFHRHQRGHLPTFKVGFNLWARKSELDEFFSGYRQKMAAE